jgi:hypothetical protein
MENNYERKSDKVWEVTVPSALWEEMQNDLIQLGGSLKASQVENAKFVAEIERLKAELIKMDKERL